MTLPQETMDKIKADADNYAGVMAWITQHPKGEEQLFYEYISATSHEAGATEWAEKAQGLLDALKLISEMKTFTDKEGFVKQIADNAIAKYEGKEVTNG